MLQNAQHRAGLRALGPQQQVQEGGAFSLCVCVRVCLCVRFICAVPRGVRCTCCVSKAMIEALYLSAVAGTLRGLTC